MSVSSGPARVSTRLAIGRRTHGSILICSPKNRLRLLDTFFRNPCILVPDTETQSSVNGVAQGYKREREEGLWHSLESAWVFHSPQRSSKVSGKWHTDCWQIALGGQGFSQGNLRGL